MIELNLFHNGGLETARRRFLELFEIEFRDRPNSDLTQISNTYYRCNMSVNEWRSLIQKDEEEKDRAARAIYRIWPDFPLQALIDRSVVTVKADAATRSYAAVGEGIAWAVVLNVLCDVLYKGAGFWHVDQFQDLGHRQRQ